jgi:hypothetical protein
LDNPIDCNPIFISHIMQRVLIGVTPFLKLNQLLEFFPVALRGLLQAVPLVG